MGHHLRSPQEVECVPICPEEEQPFHLTPARAAGQATDLWALCPGPNPFKSNQTFLDWVAQTQQRVADFSGGKWVVH